MRIAKLAFVGLVAVVLALTGCPGVVDGDGDGIAPTEDLTFDLTGAKALAAGEDAARKADGEDAFQLVKILEDGSIEPVLEMAEGSNWWFPDVMFIAKAPDDSGDVYVALQWSLGTRIHSHEDPDTGEWIDGYDVTIGSFMHIQADGTVTWVDGGLGDGQVRDNSWWGAEDYKPIDFDTIGNLYFVRSTWNSSGEINVLYKYNPTTQTTEALTAEIEGFYYDQFQVDPSGQRLFVKGQRWSSTGTTSNFFRMYPVLDMAHPVTIYYTSESDIWVRGFEISPSGAYVVMNGWNIRGNNGMIKVDIAYDNTLTYSTLYNSDTSDWFNPIYNEWYDDWAGRSVYEGLFDEVEQWRMRVLMTDGTNFQYAQLNEFVWDPDFSGPFWFWDDASQTSFEVTIGTDWWFSTDDTDPAATSAAINWNELTDPLDLNYAGDDPIFKLEWWYWDETGDHTEYKDVRQEVIDFFEANPDVTRAYVWDEHWFADSDDDGLGDYASNSLDALAIMAYIGSFYIEDIEFSYGSDLTVANGSIGEALDDQPYTEAEVWGPGGVWSDPWFFLNEHVVKASDTSEAATTFKAFREANDLGWLDFQNVGNMFFDGTGQLWGVLGDFWGSGGADPKPIKLLDSAGKRDLEVVDVLAGDDYKPVGFTMKGDHMYFRNALTDVDGFELGYHQMLRFDFTQEVPTVDDTLANVSNNDILEILDFSIDDNDTWLYFTALEGVTTVVGGKIDLEGGFTFTPFDAGMRLKNIEVY